jgi:hypothetical protein
MLMSIGSRDSSAVAFNAVSEAAPAPLAKRRILISIPSGFQVRQFLHSGVLDALLHYGSEVLILSPNQKDEGFATDLPSEGVKVCLLQPATGPVLRRYWQARQHLLLSDQPTETLRQKMIDFRRRYRLVAAATQKGNLVLRRFPRLRQQVLQWEHLVLHDKALDALLATEAVDLILVGSPGYMMQDACLLHAAVRRRIPVMAAIMSWDNLSSKGLVNPRPDHVLVWSDHMRQEAINIQGIPAERIIETGSLVHDSFAKAGRYGSRAENLRHLGLDPQRRMIFYGGNHAGSFPDEIEVVKRIARWVEEDTLGIPCQLWVRLHPQAVAGPYAVPINPYRSLASARVKIELPPVRVRDSKLPWDLPRSDLEHLVRLMRDADVVINTASTIAIDAAILDRPVIGVAYDPAGDLPYERSIRRYYDWTHMVNVISAGAIQLATSPDDLRQKIVAYLKDPTLDREGRKRIVAQQFGRVDGGSGERVVKAIVQVLQSKGEQLLHATAGATDKTSGARMPI